LQIGCACCHNVVTENLEKQQILDGLKELNDTVPADTTSVRITCKIKTEEDEVRLANTMANSVSLMGFKASFSTFNDVGLLAFIEKLPEHIVCQPT